MTVRELKNLPKEEFMKMDGATEEIYEILKNSKEGNIRIKHKTREDEYYGHTDAFAEGISVRLDNPHGWYITSVIKEINWDEGWFKTLNSVYDFKFVEDEVES